MRRNLKLSSLFCGAVAALSLFASCQDYDFMDEGEIKHDLTVTEYAENFINHFGEPDPNHSWGMALSMGDGMTTRTNVANKNEWESIYHLEVPGWPDIYKKENDPSIYNNGYHYYDDGDHYDMDKTGHSVPAGDVTDEEIQYVSWWFRTHKPAKSEIVHWSDFFIQEISSDWDRNPDGTVNKTATRYEYKEIEGVKQWDKSYPDLPSNPTIDYFEVKTLGNAFDHIYNFNSGASNNIFDAVKVPMGSDERTSPWNTETETIGSTSHRMCDFYTSSGTEDFSAHYSNDNTDRNYTWTIVHLTFVGKSGRLYDGWYLGFDYEFYKEELWFSDSDEIPDGKKVGDASKYIKYDRDGYYNNWIVKITPATPVPPTPSDIEFTRRVMCEDLGNTYDFDFNDVVFDATYNITESDYRAYAAGTKTDSPIDVTITIQAAGGTMPIYVGVDPDAAGSDKYEAHALLNHDSRTPVNVGGASSHVAIYHIGVVVDPLNPQEALNLNSIPIYVINGGKKIAIKNNGSEYYANAEHPDHYNPSNTGNSNVPQKFAVPTSVRWMKECKFIETAYPHFCDWVKDENGAYREKSNTGTAEWKKPWYDNSNISEAGRASLAGSGFGYDAPNPDISTDDPITPEDPAGPDYSEYGDKLTVGIWENTWGNDYYINYTEFSSYGEEFVISVICKAANSQPGIGPDAKLLKGKFVEPQWEGDVQRWDKEQNNPVSTASIGEKDENGIYIVTFNVNKNAFSTSDGYTSLLIDNLYSKGDQVISWRAKNAE